MRKEAMRGPNTKAFKQAFLKNLLLSLQACRNYSPKAMSIQERKFAIKSSADIAMAAACGSAARWPQALLAASSKPCFNLHCKVQRCKNIVRRSCHMRRYSTSIVHARTLSSAIARRLVKKRTMVLRKLIPGGEFLDDEISLLYEALDYVVHLRAQVDVLRCISKAAQRPNSAKLREASSFREKVATLSEEEEMSSQKLNFCNHIVHSGDE